MQDIEEITTPNDVIGVIKTAAHVIIYALGYLYPETWFIGFSLIEQEIGDGLWVFDVMNEQQKIQVRYEVTDIVSLLIDAREEGEKLLNANPHYHDVRYLIGVGTEHALNQYKTF